jgi:alpha-mannosidase
MSYPHLNLDPVPKKVDSIYTHRLRQFLQEGQYKSHSLPLFYEHGRVHEGHVKLEVFSVEGTQNRPPFAVGSKGPFRPAAKGESFGPSWATHWFKIQVKVPAEWANADVVHFNWNGGNEGLVWSEDGRPVVGLSGEERREWILPKNFQDGQWHTFYIEAACNGMFGNADPADNIQPPVPDRYFKLESADLVWPNADARGLKWDFIMIRDAAQKFPEDSWQRNRALAVANAIMDAFDESDVNSIKKCREIASEFIGKNVDSDAVFQSQEKSIITAVGHCHIDTAWLWPYAETRRKIGRSWASQLDLIERYPEYNFVCSQAVQYKWLKEDYPELFERLKVQIKKGRFIPIGGSWVESDTNMPSGEAIARQFLYGQRFFESNFGIRCNTFWLPDTFGYAAQIPQLCRGAGMERFLTQKLSWNNINKFPNTTFNWVALDGSQVLCHMPPSDTYNSNCSIEEIQRSIVNHKNRDIDESSLLVFGFGDGGGGPTTEMLEKLRRARGISDTVGQLPRVGNNGNVDSFFDNLAAKTDNGKKLVSWVGELYFEYHRGTYTTQAFTKRSNRQGEVLLHDLEYLATLLSVKYPDYKYPKKELDHIWDMVLLNQFHDVLPGSSIELVYDDVREIVDGFLKVGDGIFATALTSAGISTASQGEVVALNTLPWGRQEVIRAPGTAQSGVAAQATADGHYVYVQSEDAGFSAPVSAAAAGSVSAKEVKAGVFVLENDKIRATIEGAQVVSIFDKSADKEIITEGGKGNEYVIFEDQPLNWQGWDTEVYSLNKKKVISAGTTKIHESGPIRASVVVEQTISDKSWIKTIISLDAYTKPVKAQSPDVSYLEFNVEVEWNEACKFLKTEFPVNVHADYATYDSMYGSVRRPTHYNTFWDVAKFEVCCHKYADLSDYTYGVSVLNDSKYGFAIHGNTMRLSLLRAAKAPDGNADMGRHNIRYAVVGHAGSLNADIVRAATNFNHPLKPVIVPAGTKLPHLPTLRFDGPKNIVISAVKRGEDDVDVSLGDLPARKSRSVVVRLYDSLGGHSAGKIVTELPVKKVVKVNLLEDDQEEIAFETSGSEAVIPVKLRAFEIASYRLEL